MRLVQLFGAGVAAVLVTLLISSAAAADSVAIDFESPTYTTGSIDGQDGWSSSGSYDQEVVANTYGYTEFGGQSLRISNAVTSGSFGDQTFSRSLADEAGESSAENDGMSGGTRSSRFTAEWSFASTTPNAEQPGLQIVASPDRGDGARMSWVQMADTPTGLEVNFFDFQRDNGGTCAVGDNFVLTNVASGLDRTVSHTVKIEMIFVDGPANDIVRLYADGVLAHTGTSWEDYFRECEGNPTRTVDSILFRAGGTAAPASDGLGFLIDNLAMSSDAQPVTKDDCKNGGWESLVDDEGNAFKNQGDCVSFVATADEPAGPVDETVVVTSATLANNFGDVLADPSSWFFYNDENDTIDSTLGTFVAGPETAPEGTGSAQISVTGTQRRNLATYQFSGTPLADITELRYSTFNPSAGNGGGADRSGYLQFNVDFDGSDLWQRRLLFLPSDNGTIVQDEWQEWDTLAGGDALWRYSGPLWPGTLTPGSTPMTWDQILAEYPGVRIRVTDSWLGIRVGEPYPDGYTENLDAFKFGTAAGTTTFDFEPLVGPPADASECKNGGWMTFNNPSFSSQGECIASIP